MRNINLIVLHCSDSDVPDHDNIETIRKWHVEERGWSDIGYHFIVTKCGGVFTGRPVKRRGAHVEDFNKNSIGICLTGRNDFSSEQFFALRELIKKLLDMYGLDRIDVLAHNELNPNKPCPNFGVSEIM